MRHWQWLAGLLVLVSVLAACSAEEPTEAPVALEGPALIMFYTDN
jgi:hypothetical protein